MNQRLAKRIRKEVYQGRKETVEYQILEDKSIVCIGLRRKYKEFKKEWKRLRRGY